MKQALAMAQHLQAPLQNGFAERHLRRVRPVSADDPLFSVPSDFTREQ